MLRPSTLQTTNEKGTYKPAESSATLKFFRAPSPLSVRPAVDPRGHSSDRRWPFPPRRYGTRALRLGCPRTERRRRSEPLPRSRSAKKAGLRSALSMRQSPALSRLSRRNPGETRRPRLGDSIPSADGVLSCLRRC